MRQQPPGPEERAVAKFFDDVEVFRQMGLACSQQVWGEFFAMWGVKFPAKDNRYMRAARIPPERWLKR